MNPTTVSTGIFIEYYPLRFLECDCCGEMRSDCATLNDVTLCSACRLEIAIDPAYVADCVRMDRVTQAHK